MITEIQDSLEDMAKFSLRKAYSIVQLALAEQMNRHATVNEVKLYFMEFCKEMEKKHGKAKQTTN